MVSLILPRLCGDILIRRRVVSHVTDLVAGLLSRTGAVSRQTAADGSAHYESKENGTAIATSVVICHLSHLPFL
jgi:hypothetical protein